MSTIPPIELHGVIHGKTIELQELSGLPDGQLVSLTVRAASPIPPNGTVHEGLLLSAGGWADGGEELDEWLKETYEARKHRRRNDPALHEE